MRKQLHQRGATFTVQYKLSDRPRKTSLVMTDLDSLWFSGGGGSWVYEKTERGTQWTRQLAGSTRHAMLKAKGLIQAATAN